MAVYCTAPPGHCPEAWRAFAQRFDFLAFFFFFATFFALTLGLPHPADDHFLRHVRGAARCGCLGLLLTGAISGALIDLGLPFFVLAALACARPTKTEARNAPACRDAHPGTQTAVQAYA